MEEFYKDLLRNKLQNNRYREVFDFFRSDLEEMKQRGWSTDLIIAFVENKTGGIITNRESFRVGLKLKYDKWKGGRPYDRKPEIAKGKGEIPDFHYYPSMEPKKKGIFEQLDEMPLRRK